MFDKNSRPCDPPDLEEAAGVGEEMAAENLLAEEPGEPADDEDLGDAELVTRTPQIDQRGVVSLAGQDAGSIV